jgi:sugar O-acyltransferase (sialic acid O-acetyltransferase NeuD family)
MNDFHESFQVGEPDFRRLYIFGAGGSGREIAWFARQAWGDAIERVFVVDRPEYLSGDVNGIPVCLLDDLVPDSDVRCLTAVGDRGLRRRAVRALSERGFRFTRLVHPRAEVWGNIELGEGSIICAGAVVTTNVSVGAHVQVNVGCTVSHDVCIGDFATLSPGVHVSGHVVIESDAFLGTGASVVNGQTSKPLVIGEGGFVAAGACVTRSVEPGAFVAGVPAVRKR